MLNSVQQLQDKVLTRMPSGLYLKQYGRYGDGTSGNGHRAKLLASMPGITPEENGELRFTDQATWATVR
jgi:hypothetical protein